MAAQAWNRVNIQFPSAVACVRIPFTTATDAKVKAMLVENDKVLKIMSSEILQTEIRVLYELLYILNNSSRGNKTYKGLQQVEQCINRLKCMKLDSALQELTELCPGRIQRALSIKAGECDVPSQPKLEWICLKVLGATQLMSCTLSRCSRAFSLTRQQMKWEEFIVLNVVITSMVSRLWVMFRGILFSLTTLYQKLLELLREVSEAQPMPFLTDFSLPADMAQFLGPPHARLLIKQSRRDVKTKECKDKQQRQQQQLRKKSSAQVMVKARKVNEDLGVAVERDVVFDTNMKPFLKIFRNLTEGKSSSQKRPKIDMKQKFKKQVRAAATFTDMSAHIEEMIRWCKSKKMGTEKRLLTFLRLKCQRMKSLEAAGYNVQRKLQAFRHEACWASCPQASLPRTWRPLAATRRKARLTSRLQSLKTRLRSSALRTGIKKKTLKTQRHRAQLSACGSSGDERRTGTRSEATSPATNLNESHDDIDDIFASVGL